MAKLRPKTAPEEAIYALTFYISGDNRPKRVLVSRTDVVEELIKKIDGTGRLSRFGVEDDALFWKVCQKSLMRSLTYWLNHLCRRLETSSNLPEEISPNSYLPNPTSNYLILLNLYQICGRRNLPLDASTYLWMSLKGHPSAQVGGMLHV
jgi:hypothetical protein